jgi:glyoxylase-like metal-dependent hydrolase (beta-lactamase superfamily II)
MAPGVHFLAGFGNTTFLVGSRCVAVVDPGLLTSGPRVVRELRAITDLPVRHVIYTHGHDDHAFGTPSILDDARQRGHADPDIVGHVNVAKRFERYQKTAGHIANTFDFQFAIWAGDGGDVVRHAEYHPPTIEFTDSITLDDLGGLALECHHGLGETDDHIWVWAPESRTIVGGDFIVSSLPNAGTPFAVRDVLRRYMGWYDGNPSMVFPSTRAQIASEVVGLIGGVACRWRAFVRGPQRAEVSGCDRTRSPQRVGAWLHRCHRVHDRTPARRVNSSLSSMHNRQGTPAHPADCPHPMRTGIAGSASAVGC